MKTAFISHPDTLLHVMDGQHPESPARINSIKQTVTQSPLNQKLQFLDAPLATKQQLTRAHHATYVDNIYAKSPKAGLVRLDADTAMGPHSLEATLRASGAAILATDLVMQGKVKNAFCCTRPPGHHAGQSNSAGFCIFNHVAIAAMHVLAHYPIKRVAIIDFDVHHGDGTENIVKDNPAVMLCSTFQHPFYPHKGAFTRTDRMINVPLAAGTDGHHFKKAVIEEFTPALERFKPEVLFVSAGFDAHSQDPLADLMLEVDDYAWITQYVVAQSVKYCEGRIISCLEGGYHLQYLGQCVLAHLLALTEST
ncbi:MAG: histone deacetylase family protein [Methylophilus sp.]|nr:histone deacetylase family protein [Methylophilus sp.]